jgi:hypothetical protein
LVLGDNIKVEVVKPAPPPPPPPPPIPLPLPPKTIQFPQYPVQQPIQQPLPYQQPLPLAQLQPLISSQPTTVPQTGPAAVGIMGAGVAGAWSWIRRRRR